MSKIIVCCGCVCPDCPYYPTDCAGCAEIKGKAFWLEYTGEKICEIYNCCVLEKKLPHCGLCAELPCAHYNLSDPTKTDEENAEDHRRQMETLRLLNEGAITQ